MLRSRSRDRGWDDVVAALEFLTLTISANLMVTVIPVAE
jgi:hypothetical protein